MTNSFCFRLSKFSIVYCFIVLLVYVQFLEKIAGCCRSSTEVEQKKNVKNGVFRRFLENLDQYLLYFGALSPFKINIDWRQKPLWKNFKVSQPK